MGEQRVIATLNIGGKSLRPQSRASYQAAAERWGAEFMEIRKPIRQGVHHFWQKMLVPGLLPDGTRVLQLDADMLIRGDAPSPFDLVAPDHIGLVAAQPPYRSTPPGRTVMGNRGRGVALWASRMKTPLRVPPGRYLNAGFFLYTTEVARPIFRDAYEIAQRSGFCTKGLPEQAVVSLLLHRDQHPTTWLPYHWNTLQLNASRVGRPWRHSALSTFIHHFFGEKKHIHEVDWKHQGMHRGAAIARWCQTEYDQPPKKIVEVGIHLADNAARLLSYFPDLHLTMVDKWREEPAESEYRKSGDANANHNQKTLERHYQEALYNTQFAADRRTVLRMDSTEAANYIEDGSQDGAFLDSDHSLPGARKAIQDYLPKIKPGGWIAGHDYGVKGWGVTRAVDELADRLDKRICIREDFTWFIRLDG